MWLAFGVSCNLSLTYLTTQSAQLLTCVNVEVDNVPGDYSSRLAYDLDVSCPRTATLRYLMAFTGLGMVACMLLASAFAMQIFGPFVNLKDPKWRYRLGFLFASYRPERRWWESIEIVFKLTLSCVTALLAPYGAPMQIFSAIILIFLVSWLYD